MSLGDYGVIFRWIDDFIKKGEVRRAKKLTSLQKDLEYVDMQINAEKIKKIPDYKHFESLLVRKRRLSKRIQSFAR